MSQIGLFTPLTLRDVTFRNRIFVSPMCQYSADTDGRAHEWHFAHLAKFAVGGAGLVMTEATAVTPEGRLSPGDTGLWNDAQADSWVPIVDFLKSQGAATGVQLGHAGRKASTTPPWADQQYIPVEDGGWETIGASDVAFGELPRPRPLDGAGIASIVRRFAEAAARAREIGFDVLEMHAAHGYLAHQFLSPITNTRTDAYGGDFDGRIRFLVEVVDAMRNEWPDERPFFVRLSATDWFPGGWDLDDTVAVSRVLRNHGVDLIDCSSGGTVPDAEIPVGPGYQVPFAREVRDGAGIATGAVGMITEASQAEEIIAEGSADAVLMGRALLRQPHWALLAAVELGETFDWPVQYATSRPREAR